MKVQLSNNQAHKPIFQHPVCLILRVGTKKQRTRAVCQGGTKTHSFIVGERPHRKVHLGLPFIDKGFVVGANNKNRDAEGVAFLPHRQSVMVVGEADSMIKEYSLDGKAEGRQLQLEKGVGNGGYESLAYDGSRGLLFTCTENPLPEDLQTDDNEPWRFRIQAIDESSLKVLGSWLYVADKPVGKAYKAGNYAFGISELTALDNNKVLVLERECYVPKKKIGAWVRNKIYCVTLSKNHGFSENLYGSTQAVDKTLIHDLFNLPGNRIGFYLNKPIPVAGIFIISKHIKVIGKM